MQVVGDALQVTSTHGTMTIPRAALSAEAQRRYFPPVAATPIPRPPAAPGPAPRRESRAQALHRPRLEGVDVSRMPPDFPPPPAGVKVETRKLTLPVNLPQNKNPTVHYRISLINGKPGPNADIVVFYAPYYSQKKFFERPYQKLLTERLGFTVFSLQISSDIKNVEDPQKMYYYAESGWHDVVFQAQEMLTKKYGLTPRNLLVIGDSGGATMAERLAIDHPDKIDAVAIAGGHRYEPAVTESLMPWCILSTRGDERLADNRALVAQLREGGAQVLAAVTPPEWRLRGGTNFDHTASETSEMMLATFISGVARNRRAGVLDPAKWPFLYDAKSPRRIVANDAGAASIPAERRRYLPSADAVRAWRAMPWAAQKIAMALPGGGTLEARVAWPRETQPKGIILYHQRWSGLTHFTMTTDADFLADRGFVVIAPRIAETESDPEKLLADSLAWLVSQQEAAGLLLFVAGFAEAAPDVLRVLAGRSLPGLAGVALVGMKPATPAEQQSITTAMGALRAPLLWVQPAPVDPAEKSRFDEMERVARFNKVALEVKPLRPGDKGDYGKSLAQQVQLVADFAAGCTAGRGDR